MKPKITDFDTIEIRIKHNKLKNECYVTHWVDNELVNDEWINDDKMYDFLNYVFIMKYLTNQK